MAHTKAQAWGFDLFVALSIFVGGILFFYLYTINYSSGGEDTLSNLRSEANLIADSLFTEGAPINWTEDNVVRIGFLSNGKINQTKLDQFYDFVGSDYNQTKQLFRIKEEYYLEFQDPVMLSGSPGTQIGRVPADPSEYDNLIKITRVVLYENNLTAVHIYSWE